MAVYASEKGYWNALSRLMTITRSHIQIKNFKISFQEGKRKTYSSSTGDSGQHFQGVDWELKKQ